MIRMRMRDDRAGNFLPRINVKITGFTIQTRRGLLNQRRAHVAIVDGLQEIWIR
jgi:hypothetical protein